MIESDDQKLVVRRVLRDGRRRYEPGSKARLVAACLEPGVSVSRLALDNGINANLLRKWIKEAKAADPERRFAPSAFVPVVAEDRSLSTDLAAMRGEMCLARSEGAGPLSSPVKVNASLPNGVKLTVESGDVDALAAMIGALGHVQTGR